MELAVQAMDQLDQRYQLSAMSDGAEGPVPVDHIGCRI